MSDIGVAEEPVERLYTASLYYIRQDVSHWEVHLVVTQDTETHNTAVREYYESVNAVEGPHIPIVFESGAIKLDIPEDGIDVNGWRIKPFMNPAIGKRHVDDLKPGMLIPCIQMTANYQLTILQGGTPPNLSYLLSIDGAKEPNNKIPIDINFSKEEQFKKQMDVFKKAIDTKGSRPQTSMQLTIQGNARSGKTSFLKVVSGEKADPKEPSMGVMNKPARVEIRKSAIRVDELEWTAITDLQDEADLMMQHILDSDSPAQSSASATSSSVTTMFGIQTLANNDKEQIHSPRPPVSLNRPTRRKIERMLKTAVRRAGIKMKTGNEPWTIYLSDIGGQLEFQELVPALTHGPSLHVIIIRASRDLNSKLRIEYLHRNGQHAHSYLAEYTAKDDLLLSLATIMSTGRLGQLPRAIVVLTFKDQVTKDVLLKMDLELQEVVRSTDAFKKGVLVFATQTRLCHSINNLSPDKADLFEIRETILRIGRQNQDYYRITTPYIWMYFSIALREIGEVVLSYDDCLQVGKECGLETKDEVNEALSFLHNKVGVIRHYSQIPDLRDLVIIEPQLLFDNVSELVVNTFTFERVGNAALEEFKKNGIFPAEMIDKLATNSDLLTPKKFLSFLKEHHIVAPLEEGGVVTKYFLPCSLVHADVVRESPACDDTIPPLIVTFDTGYTPRGIFGFLVTDLLKEKSSDDFRFELNQDVIYRNQVTLSVYPSLDNFRFSVHPSYVTIDFVVDPLSPRNCRVSLPMVCSFVRERTCHGLSTIVNKLNYNCEARHSLGFMCPDVSNGPHPATITFFRGEPLEMICTVNKQRKDIPIGHEVWFKKSIDPGPSSTPDTDLTLHNLTVVAPISITQSPPERQEVGEGKSDSLTVSATGSDPTFHWFKDNKPLTDNESFQGLDEHKLVIRKATTDLSGSYSCRVSNNISEEDSIPCKLVIVEAPTISQQPEDNTALEGEDVSLSVTAEGENLTYKWRKHYKDFEDYLENGKQYENVKSHRLIIRNATHKHTGTYSCEVSNLGGKVSSQTAALTLSEQPKYLKQLEELMKDKGTIDVRYLKLYFIGLSGLGKTTFRERFTRLLVNISSLPPEDRQRRSTHLAECTQVLAVTSDSKLELKVSNNVDEEAQTIFHYLYEDRTSASGHPPANPRPSDSDNHPASQPKSSDNHPPAQPKSTDDHSSAQLERKSHEIAHSTPKDSNSGESDGSPANHQSSSTSPDRTSDNPQSSSDATIQLGTTKPNNTSETSTTASTKACIDPMVKIKEIFDRLREVVGSGKYAEELLGKILLNMIDMGGQPGFLEMLPFLSTGPGMYLVFLPLDKELDQQYEVTYEREGDRITPYKTTYTVRETISQILSSISHHTTCDPTAERMLGDKFQEFKTVQPIATLVGTFKDKVDLKVKKTKLQEELREEFHSEINSTVLDSQIECILLSRSDEQGAKDFPSMEIPEITRVNLEHAISRHLASETFKREVKHRIDEELKKIHVALEEITSCFGHVIANPVFNKEHRFFAVDNFDGTDADLDPIRQHLCTVFEQKFEKAKVPIRPAQLLFGIILRKEFDIVTKDECFQIGKKLRMSEKDVEFTIWYLHHCVGALIHHPDIEDLEHEKDGEHVAHDKDEKDSEKSWFKDNIICSPQVVFDSISNLIVKSLLELHSASGNIAFVEMEQNNWFKKGQFSLETIECCQSKEIKKDVEEGKLIPVQKLVKLLQHVHLLSPIKTKRFVGHKQETITRYFMPAILECASSEELLTPPPSCDDSPAPILITFECGYVPIGLFCAMIARLVSKGSDGILGLKWELDVESHVKRNIVSFCVSDRYHTTLISHVNCYEIRVTNVSKTTKSQSKLPDICTYVLTTVQFILKEISALVRLTIAFDCPCEQHQSDKRNWCKLCEGAITGFRCENRDVLLTRSQLYWFAKEVQSGKNVHLQALPFAKRKTEGEFSFSWLQQPSCSNELIIKSDSPDCIGYYTCEVRKDKSDDDPYFTVHRCLFAPISITQSPPERQEAGEGETVSLTVTATGTDPTYQWLKDNKPLTDNDSFQGLDEHKLVIRKATTDLSGSYSCKVSNNISEEVSKPAKLVIGNPHIKRLIHKRPNDDFELPEKKRARISQSEESKPEHEDEYMCCSENEDNCSSENKHTIWWGQTSVSTATGLMGAVSGASESPPLMQFCTEQTREDDVPQEQQQLASDDRAYGSIRTDKMWDLTRFRELKIHFLNPGILTDPRKPWRVSVDAILAWATCTWNTPTSVYPKLRDITATKDEAQIRVKFDVSQRCWSKVGKDALTVVNKDEPTMVLNLYGLGIPEQKSYVIHEFGHALGLDHEHQRSDFWDVLGEKDGNGDCRFIIGESKMKSGNHNQCQKACSEHFKAPWATTKLEQSEYDSESIMHYWFDKNWLLPQYRDLNYVRNKTNGILTDLERKVIEGVHERDYSNGILVEQPSRLDYEVLNNAYKTKMTMQSTDASEPLSLSVTTDFQLVYETLYPARPNWYSLGLALKLSPPTLGLIKIDNQKHPYRSFHDILLTRMKMLPMLTWREIIEALRHPSVGERELALSIERQYGARHGGSEGAQPQSMSATGDVPSPTIDKSQQDQTASDLSHGIVIEKIGTPTKPMTFSALSEANREKYINIEHDFPGIEVIAQTYAVVTNSPDTFKWKGHGFSIDVPADSLPKGVRRCVLGIYASISGQYDLPDNHELVSAVYWVRPEPYCDFKRPLTVELQHCAQKRYSKNLSFVRAVCTQKNLPYTFKKIEGSGTFTAESSYGSINLNHFSCFGVTAEGPVERLYTAGLYYLGRDVCSWEIHLVVTWDNEPHVTTIQDHYERESAVKGCYIPIEFVGESIELNIPMAGVPVGNWIIRPLISPQLAQTRVDYFRPGQKIPCCQLIAEFPPQEAAAPKLYHLLSITGAKEPDNMITIEIDPAWLLRGRDAGLRGTSFAPDTRASENGCKPLTLEILKRKTGVTEDQLTSEVEERDLFTLAGYFDNVDDYLDKLGLALGQQTDVKDIVHRQGVRAGVDKALRCWQQPNPYDATFRALLDILLVLKKGNVAVQVCKYLVGRD